MLIIQGFRSLVNIACGMKAILDMTGACLPLVPCALCTCSRHTLAYVSR